MRTKIIYSKNTTPVEYANQTLLNSYFNKCLGPNNKFHDISGLYNVSSIQGGRRNAQDNTLDFEKGCYFCVSSPDLQLLGDFINKISKHPELFHGMKLKDFEFMPKEKFVNGWNHFLTLSPFLLRDIATRKCLTFENTPNFIEILEQRIINKLKKINANFDLSDFKIALPEHNSNKVKAIMVKKVINFTNQCSIDIHTNKEVAEFLYDIGIGQSTNSGFGTIYKFENYELYRRPEQKAIITNEKLTVEHSHS